MSMATKTNELLIVAEEGTCSITNSTRIPYIPNEIIVEILSRLPVKSLLRFRCVCMSWLALISNRQFIKKHLHMSTTDHNKYSRHRLINKVCEDDGRIRSCSLDSIYQDLHIDSIKHDHTSEEQIWVDRMVGTYDGLILIISDYRRIHLWNPSLKKSMMLPNVGFEVYSQSRFGIGYDYSIDDYKVVAMSHFEVGVYTYTLRTNSWKRIGLFPRGRPDNGSGHFVSGALHWTSRFSRHDKFFPAWTIIALDLATETYHEVASPVHGDNSYDSALGVLRECLCVMIHDQTRRLTNLWIMKEYGVGKPWTKLASIPYFMKYSLSKTPLCPNKTPLFISEKGELLFAFEHVIYLCNSKDNSFRYPVTDDNFFGYEYNSTIYIESLVSPNADDTTERRGNSTATSII